MVDVMFATREESRGKVRVPYGLCQVGARRAAGYVGSFLSSSWLLPKIKTQGSYKSLNIVFNLIQ